MREGAARPAEKRGMAFIIMIYRYLQVGPYGAMRRAALTLNHLRAVKIKQNCPVKVRETNAR